jgi:hypothetical protein
MMKVRTNPNATAVLRSLPIEATGFTVDPVYRVNVTSEGSVTPSQVDDIAKTTHTGATFEDFAELGVEALADGAPVDATFTVESGSGIEVSALGVVTKTDDSASASGRIRIESAKHTRHVDITLTKTTGGEVTHEDGYASGSLAAHIHAQINALIDGKGTGDMSLFTSRNDSTATYVRNTGNWAAPVLPVFTSTWTETNKTRWPITAISPQYAIGVEHKRLAVGTVARWVAANNTVVERTIESSVMHKWVDGVLNRDIQIYKLNEPLPESIGYARVMFDDVADYLPSVAAFPVWRRPPLLTINNAHKAVIFGWYIRDTASFGYIYGAWAHPDGDAYDFYVPFGNGDSSSPLYAIIDGEAVLVSLTTSTFQGTVYHKVISEINAKIAALGGSETLTTVDLSEFPSYGD